MFKNRRKEIPSHPATKEPPEAQYLERLATPSNHFIDTIKMITYPAETAMVHIVRHQMARHDDGRSLLRAIYATEPEGIDCDHGKSTGEIAGRRGLGRLMAVCPIRCTIYRGTRIPTSAPAEPNLPPAVAV